MHVDLKAFLADDRGASAVEYGLIIALISFAVAAGFSQFADSIAYLFGDTDSKVSQALK